VYGEEQTGEYLRWHGNLGAQRPVSFCCVVSLNLFRPTDPLVTSSLSRIRLRPFTTLGEPAITQVIDAIPSIDRKRRLTPNHRS